MATSILRFHPYGFSNIALVKAVQPANASRPMRVTLLGMVTLVKDEHLRNAPSSILVTPSGIVTLVNEVQPANVP